MKILHIIPTLGGGGAERFVVDLINEQSKTQAVTLCTLFQLNEGGHGYFLDQVSDRIRIRSLDKRKGLDLSIYVKLARLIYDVRPDVVHTHLASINYVFPLALLKRKIRFVHTIHSDAQFEIKHPLELKTRKWLYARRLIKPITISRQSQQSFRKLYRLDVDRLIFNGRQVQHATDSFSEVELLIDRMRTSENTRVLLHVGRFVAVKRQVMLAKVVDELTRSGHDLQLIFLGDADTAEGREISEAIRQLENPAIHLLGAKSNVIDYLICADALCISSSNEGLPMSLLEALSVGCIPVSTPVGGMVDIITDEVGYLSADLEPASYQNALLSFLNSVDRQEKSEQAKAVFYEHFNISSVSDQYLNAYEG